MQGTGLDSAKELQASMSERPGVARLSLGGGLGIAALIAGTAFAVFAQTLMHDFISWDDSGYVTRNETVLAGVTLDGLMWALKTFHMGNWHPVTWLSHMVDVELFGLWAGGHHLSSIVLHAANSVLVFSLLYRASKDWQPAALVALMFAVHPLHVESVAWVAERKDLLCAFFWLLALSAYISWVDSRNIRAFLFLLLFSALALMAKPMAVSLPISLLLLDIWPLRRWNSRSLRALLPLFVEKAPIFILVFASAWVTLVAQGSAQAVTEFAAWPLEARLANAVLSYGAYFLQTLLPVDLAFFYPQRNDPRLAELLAALALILGLGCYAVLRISSQGFLAVGLAWWLITLIPTIGLVQVGMQSRADRYMYFPILGLLVMLGWLWWHQPSRLRRAIVLGLLTVLILSWTWTTIGYTAQWKDNARLYSHAISTHPKSCLPYALLARTRMQEKKLQEASMVLSQGMQNCGPDSAANLLPIALGDLEMRRNNPAAAVEHYLRAAGGSEASTPIMIRLSGAMLSAGNHAEARRYALAALRYGPNAPDALRQFGRVLTEEGDFAQSAVFHEKWVAMEPRSAEAWYGLALAYDRKGELAAAVDSYRRASAIEPRHLGMRLQYGWALWRKGQVTDARNIVASVLKDDPNSELAHSMRKRFEICESDQTNKSCIAGR